MLFRWASIGLLLAGGCGQPAHDSMGGAEVNRDGGSRRVSVVYPLKYVSGSGALSVTVMGAGDTYFEGAKKTEDDFRKVFSKDMGTGYVWEVNVAVLDENKIDAESVNRAIARILRAADQKMEKQSSLIVRVYSQELMHQFWQGTSARTGKK